MRDGNEPKALSGHPMKQLQLSTANTNEVSINSEITKGVSPPTRVVTTHVRLQPWNVPVAWI